ncbi:cation-translocating P-type ATPase [uncultured Lactobacillus sp.]|uniref:cation-translocating P-type ATPase n=1 Tax=uncultured Lactobacillus sp. TaxID=153152 RepID=UPI00261313CA|nr:cation-translocating P-type ATPase [uncultured Lactobacillus sp.]
MDNHRSRLHYSEHYAAAFQNLNSNSSGLSQEVAQKRLAKQGLNELTQKPPKSFFTLLKEQIWDPMIFILLTASLLAGVLHEWVEAIVILTIIVLNALIGIIQEKKATSSLAALNSIAAPTACVIRKTQQLIPAKELVVGDIVELSAGDKVPADLRLIETANFKVEQSALTGESISVSKKADAILTIDCPIADQINMAFAGSIVTCGHGKGIVVATGMNTEIGQIAGLIAKQDNVETPLKKKLNDIGKKLTIIGLIICVAILAIGIVYNRPIVPQFLVAISLAISIIPEGLPATASIVMALSVKRMAKNQALIKKLPAVETLGNATVICSDKTGTLTRNQMTVTHFALGHDFSNHQIRKINDFPVNYVSKQLTLAACLCNDANFDKSNPTKTIGDPTEGALLHLVDHFKFNLTDLRKSYPRLSEKPFDSDRKLMTTVHHIDDQNIAYTKGAIDELLSRCDKILIDNTGETELTNAKKEQILALNQIMANDALRVLGFAKKIVPSDCPKDSQLEEKLTFIGMVGLIDPPRSDAAQAVQTCQNAGIKTIMITGDHKLTAVAIAKQLNIYTDGDFAISGKELNQMSDKQLDESVKKATVFARVSPSDKLRIIESLKRNNEIVAMTGDGVNDSPALKAAHIGIAMGQNGTDVAIEASDMVLLDDSFSTIVSAIKEGRRVYRNIQKIIHFLLVGNIAEISTLALATIFNWDAPLLAVHILWVNLATATVPALALGVDPAANDIMQQKPAKMGTLFEKGLVKQILFQGFGVAILTLAAFIIGNWQNYATGQTMAFSVLASCQILRSFSLHSNVETITKKSFLRNPWLLISFFISTLFMGVILFTPQLQEIFHLVDLNFVQWLAIIFCAGISMLHIEFSKARRKMQFQDRIIES